MPGLAGRILAIPPMTDSTTPSSAAALSGREERLGLLLVFLSAFAWSTGGAIARFLEADDSWTVVFWRSLFAALFLIAFLLVRDGAPYYMAHCHRRPARGLRSSHQDIARAGPEFNGVRGVGAAGTVALLV